ncbi:unnamed protein product [Candidula unifasciata]|uniref:Uncharacterized protein n=1 Tax=Candidula unifasciata TaxID=100452 RepID=A0A8S3Z7M5_9EUPU|nr:unnamed protein product [Candidula unifasciata]
MGFLFFCHLALLTIANCQAQNATNQTEVYSTNNSLASPNASITETVTNITETVINDPAGIDEGDSGKADDLADYIKQKFGEIIGLSQDEAEPIQESATTPNIEDLSNCSVPVVLDHFCEGVPDNVFAYFKYNMSLPGILASIFTPEIVGTLQLNCTTGSWCLPQIFHQDVISSKARFYVESPFCSDAMWSCLKNMQDKRVNCSDEWLDFLVSTVILLCDLEGSGDLSQECYARTVEGLYVTFADLTNPAGSQTSKLKQADCNDYKVQMTKTYLCADDVCNYDQNLLLEEFLPWVDLAREAADVAQNCNITRTCQSDYEAEDTEFPYNYYDNYPSYTEYNEDSDEYGSESYGDDQKQEENEVVQGDISQEGKQSTGNDIILENSNVPEQNYDSDEGQDIVSSSEGGQNEDDGLNAGANDGYDTDDRSMLLGLIVMTTALLFGFVGLAFIVYRRFKRGKNYKWGYSQLINQEQKLVQNDYK